MKNLIKKTFYALLILVPLSSCQGIKDGITGKKRANSDEFLIEKKNPLIEPPDFKTMPKPNNAKASNEVSEVEINFKSILEDRTTKKKSLLNSKKSDTTLEKSILEKIKSN